MIIGKKIRVSTGVLTVTALPNKVNRLYTFDYKSDVSSKYDGTVQMGESHLKQLTTFEKKP